MRVQDVTGGSVRALVLAGFLGCGEGVAQNGTAFDGGRGADTSAEDSNAAVSDSDVTDHSLDAHTSDAQSSDGPPEVGQLVLYPAPLGVPASPDYSVQANSKPVFVYVTPVNDNHFDYKADGQTLASVAYFDMSGSVQIAIRPTTAFTGVDIRPKSLGILPTISGGTIAFTLTRPSKLTVELLGTKQPVDALHLFANALEVNPPKPTDPSVTYFGPGIHDGLVGKVSIGSNQSVYIAGGAIVYGSIFGAGDNMRITGRGILTGGRATLTGHVDPSQVSGGQYKPVGQLIKLDGCTKTTVSGIILLDTGWSITPHECDGVTIEDVKIINGGYTSDGIDVLQSQNVAIDDVFLRTWDDSIALKATSSWSSGPAVPVQGISVTRTIHWNDWGGSLVFGAETQCAAMSDIHWSDIDVIHQFEHDSFALEDTNQASISNVSFENVRVEDVAVNPYQPGLVLIDVGSDHLGSFSNVTFKDITINAPIWNESRLSGYDAKHGIDGVVFQNVVFNGTRWVDVASARMTIGSFVTHVTFR